MEEGLSHRGMLALIDRRIDVAEALVAWQVEAHKASCPGSCEICGRLATWRAAKGIHEKTERPRPLTREPKRNAYFDATERRLTAAEAIAWEAYQSHRGAAPYWSECSGGANCRVCSLFVEWRDARFIQEAVMRDRGRCESLNAVDDPSVVG
jgi:hypothetical protein